MKYRFRPSGRKSNLPIAKGTQFQLKRADFFEKPRNLPIPVSTVENSEDVVFSKKKRVFSLKRMRERLNAFLALAVIFFKKCAKALFSRLKKVCLWLKKGILAIFHAIAAVIEKGQKNTVTTLPMLAGALTAALLVCALTAGYAVFGLFSRYMRSYDTVTVPTLLGKEPYLNAEENENFNLIIEYENNPEVASGLVITQHPAPGVTRRIYQKDGRCDIRLTVSVHSKITVPEDILGKSARDASLALKNLGLVCSVKEEYSLSADKGSVISVYPAGGSRVKEGDTVTLTVSLGKELDRIRVPKLTGLSETEAAAHLQMLGLVLGDVTYKESDAPVGTVISQAIAPYSTLDEGGRVDITVSGGIGYPPKIT